MNLVFEKISQTLAAGEKLIIGIAGSFIRLSECQWPVTVVLIKENRIVGEMKNMLAGDYASGVEFDAVWIVNGASGQAVGVQISAGGAGSNRVLGEVSVIDGGKFRTLSGAAFIMPGVCQALAANLSHCQLINPVGSNKRAIISGLQVSADVASAVSIRYFDSPLSTLVGAPVSKLSGGAASAMEYRTQNSPAPIGTTILYGNYFQANQIQNLSFKEPIVLNPGRGLVGLSSSINANFYMAVELIEEPI